MGILFEILVGFRIIIEIKIWMQFVTVIVIVIRIRIGMGIGRKFGLMIGIWYILDWGKRGLRWKLWQKFRLELLLGWR